MQIKKTLMILRKHWFLSILLIILQLAVVATGLGVYIYHQKLIISNMEGILLPLNEANYEADDIQEGLPFLKQMAPVVQQYKELQENLVRLFFWLGAVFVALHGGAWVFVHFLTGRRKIFRLWLRFALCSAIVLVPLMIVSYVWIRSDIQQGMDPQLLLSHAKVLAGVFVTAYYLLLVSYAFLDLPLKRQFQQTLRSILPSVPVGIVNILLLTGSIWLLSITSTYLFAPLAAMLFIALLALTKIFWVVSLRA